MSQESEQAQEAWRLKALNGSAYPGTFLLGKDAYKAALKAEIEKHKKMLEDAKARAEEEGMDRLVSVLEQAIAENEVFLSLLDTVTPIK